ncbi:MAG: helix-turn-helix transcriptional regulator [Brevundimonas sp.]|jgi:AraC-like DNA-binding protein
MVVQPICEPVRLPLGINALVTRVTASASAPPPARLLHFHDVAEIVLFGETRGHFECDTLSFPITPGCAVFAPTMRYHDFHFEAGPKNWTLIQVDPYVLTRVTSVPVPAGPFCVNPDQGMKTRLAVLADWLSDVAASNPADPLIDQIVGLIMHALCQIPQVRAEAMPERATQLARFMPILERLRADPGNPVPLREAAALSHLSPAYFSRRFAAVFGCGYSDYVTAFRLHIASRWIATTNLQLSEIAYASGFSSPSHFSARFRERFGMTAREYRDRLKHPA